MISRGVDIFECRICQPRDILWMWIYYRSWGVDIFECGQHFSSLVMKNNISNIQCHMLGNIDCSQRSLQGIQQWDLPIFSKTCFLWNSSLPTNMQRLPRSKGDFSWHCRFLRWVPVTLGVNREKWCGKTMGTCKLTCGKPRSFSGLTMVFPHLFPR